ncbi:carboxypeptidase-like regulatory domain-containing protein [uncultured Hymenobacter sp.]|uniref:carboxypeptidase-like regulatory domain-containing protein n=1 Tax=uncultured Hymenobacter sp. TaxID=170016 RepID=UPI0035CC1B9D
MQSDTDHLFQPGSRELLSATRDAYLRGTLSPTDVRAVEIVLEDDSVERGVALARYHELSAARRRQRGLALEPPLWVQQQLLRQPSVSAWGPLRRPGVQLALGTLLLLGGFSAVQWVRNEPLVPKPVVATFRRTVNTAAESLGRAAVYSPAEVEVAEPDPTPPASREPEKASRRAKLMAGRATLRAGLVGHGTPPAPASPDSAAALVAAPDSAAALTGRVAGSEAVGQTSASGAASSSSASPAPAGRVVRGRIFNQLGRPLAGATVLVKGTSRAAVTNAAGAYELLAPMGAVLLIGYVGYADEQASTGESTVIDATLEPVSRHDRREQF